MRDLAELYEYALAAQEALAAVKAMLDELPPNYANHGATGLLRPSKEQMRAPSNSTQIRLDRITRSSLYHRRLQRGRNC